MKPIFLNLFKRLQPIAFMSLLAIMLVFSGLLVASHAAEVDLSHPYAIQLQLSDRPIDKKSIPTHDALSVHRLYISKVTNQQGQTWYRLRLGFFPTAKAAAVVQAQLQKKFPGNWVTRVAKKERKRSARNAVGGGQVGSWLQRLIGAKGRDKVPDPAVNLDHRFALQLQLAPKPIDPKTVPQPTVLRGHRLYVAPVERGGKTWYQLRLGFFATSKAAAKMQAALAKDFPGNWVTETSNEERQDSADNRLGKTRKKKTTPLKPLVAIPTPVIDTGKPYIIQLSMSDTPFLAEQLPPLPKPIADLRLYVHEFKRNDKPVYQLRLGFFTTSNDAAIQQKALEKDYPGNWVTRVSKAERKKSIRTRLVLGAVPPAPVAVAKAVVKPAPPVLNKTQSQRVAALMEKGLKAVTQGDYSRAIQIYTKLGEFPENPDTRRALEYLGLARERKGQPAQAKAAYEQYLARYPESDGTHRVQQRLAGLITATQAPKERLRESKRQKDKVIWLFSGNLSQHYRNDVQSSQSSGTSLQLSSLDSDMDLDLRRRGGALNLRTRLSGDHRYDFIAVGDNSQFRLTTAYVDMSYRGHPLSGRVGRQTQTNGGILGRFDGLVAGYRINPSQKVNLVAGYPVELSRADQINTDQYFVGLNTDLSTFANSLDINLYVIQQVQNGETERRAVGSQLRYFKPRRSLFGLIDYDTLFRDINTIMVLGNLTLPDKSTINISFDSRHSPTLTASNALIGQGLVASTVDELVALIGHRAALELAKDRTPKSRTITLGATHPVNKRVRLHTTLTLSKLSSTPDTVGIPNISDVVGIPASGQSYFFTTQVVINKLLRDDDTTILGYRLANTSSASTSSLTFNTRFPYKKAWNLNPRARLDFRNASTGNSKELALVPSVRADYKLAKRTQIELEGGGDWSHFFDNGNHTQSFGFYFSLGYRHNF